MASVGFQVRQPYRPPQDLDSILYGKMPTPASDPLTNQYKLYNSGVQQNAEDYSGIMQGYRNLTNNAQSQRSQPISAPNYTPQQVSPSQSTYTPAQMQAPASITPQSYTAQNYAYKPTADVSSSLAGLKDLSTTGGYSEQGIADLRARGISPIRSVYASAQRDINRNRSLKGGYSPGYNATSAKMAREMSDQIGTATQNVNAGIAQNVAQNRLSAAPNYASAAGAESGLATQAGLANVNAQNQAGQINTSAANQAQLQNIANQIAANQYNAGAVNQAGQFNAGNIQQADLFNANAVNAGNQQNIQNQLAVSQFNQQQQQQPQQNQLAALQGMSSLYGTTPAMSNLFGNQALSAAQLQNQINQQNNQSGLNLVGQGISQIPRFG